MKKALLIVMAIMVSASVLTINAKDNKKKTTVASAPAKKTVLVNSNDTLSYTAGMAMTEGLMPYLVQQLKVDTAYMADFERGFKEAMTSENNPSYNAYAAGLEISKMVKTRMFPGMENELKGMPDSLIHEKFVEGFVASLHNDSTIYAKKAASSYFENRMKKISEDKKEKLYGANREAGKKFLAENAKKDSVVTTPSGLQYKVITMGTGAKPTATQEVSVKYEGKLIDGTVFDSSYKRKDQVTKFRCNQVIKGWTEALTMMPVGSTWELYIPQELAYGDHDQGKIKPYSTLIFKVELVGIEGSEKTDAAKTTEDAKTATSSKKASKKKK